MQVETVIARPRDVMAGYATDWRNDGSWIGALTEVRLVTDGEFGVGSQDASGFYCLAGPVPSRAVRRGVESDLARLKALLETSGRAG